jgi:hypothetical protein
MDSTLRFIFHVTHLMIPFHFHFADYLMSPYICIPVSDYILVKVVLKRLY